jgi:hypothetical protein
MLLIGTANGLIDLDEEKPVAGGAVTALADDLVLLDDRRLVWIGGDEPVDVDSLDRPDGQSLARLPDGTVVVGLRGAHLRKLTPSGWQDLEAFDRVAGRDSWENPAGPRPDSRSMAVGVDGRLWVNVHVGGVWWSDDVGESWNQAVEPAADVHEVAADGEGRVVVAAAVGFGWSDDNGARWSWTSEGMHGAYARGVALDGDDVLLTASTGPFTTRAAVYRGHLGDGLERVTGGLPEWFPSNVDTGCVALSGDRAALGTGEGAVWVSADRGRTWERAAADLGRVVAVDVR